MNSIAMRPGSRSSITAWPTPDQKAGFAALALSRGLSESKLLGLLIDSVLERNPVYQAGDERQEEAGEGDRITPRVRPRHGPWLRLRAPRRGRKYTPDAPGLIPPPLPPA